MIPPLIRKVRTVLRYLVPTAEDRDYIALMRAEGQFDPDYYLASTPGLKPLFRIWPERHYVQLGEANGLCPNPRFSPRAYLFHNPDLDRPGIRPLLHYMRTGAAETRQVLAPPGGPGPALGTLPRIEARDIPDPPAAVAILVHVYYTDFWSELAPALAAQHFGFDLFVTISEQPDAAGLEARIMQAFPDARVWRMPNHGRDIFPFLHLLNAGIFEPYRAVCKLHSKKSPHRADGEDWRRSLIAGILGDPVRTEARLARFLADDSAGFWVSDGHLYEGDRWWGINGARAAELLARGGLLPGHGPLRFPAGSIYWTKPPVLARLAALSLGAADFEPEQALVDGTTAHAVERIMGCLAQVDGLQIRQSADLDRPVRAPL